MNADSATQHNTTGTTQGETRIEADTNDQSHTECTRAVVAVRACNEDIAYLLGRHM
jgi:hypothetical protein